MTNFSLPPDMEQFVQQSIAAGKYANEQEVVADALRLLRDADLRHEHLRVQINDALAGVDRGEGMNIDSDEAMSAFFDDLESETHTALAAEKKQAP
jgi:putative addiction module CopG family antidote